MPRRILHGPRIAISVTTDDTFVDAVPSFGCQGHGITMIACFLRPRLLRIYLKNESFRPFRIPPKHDCYFFFFGSSGKAEMLLTEERHYESDVLKQGWERSYTFELSLAEADRINRESLKKIVCLLGEMEFCLLPIGAFR